MSNLYIYAGQVARTYSELASIKGSTLGSISVFVWRWAKGWGDPPWFCRLKIDEQTTDDMVQKIRTETFELYARDKVRRGQEIEFDPPQGPVEWKYSPPPQRVPAELQKDGGGCKHQLWLLELEDGRYYYQTHELGKTAQDPVYQSHDPLRVDREHRRLCHAESLWHPWRHASQARYVIDGVECDNMRLAAKATGLSYEVFRRRIKKYREPKIDWPEGWQEIWN